MFVTVSRTPFDSRSHLAEESHGFERALISINGVTLNFDFLYSARLMTESVKNVQYNWAGLGGRFL